MHFAGEEIEAILKTLSLQPTEDQFESSLLHQYCFDQVAKWSDNK